MPRPVTLPDGTVVQNVPDEISDQDVQQRVEVLNTSQRMSKGLAGIDGPVLDPVKQLGLGAVDAVAGPVSSAMRSNSTYWAIPGMQAFDQILRGVGRFTGAGDQGFREAGRDLSQMNQVIQSGNKPTTEAGKWTRAIGKELPYTPFGIGGPVSKGMQTLMAGVGAETGSRLFNGNPLAEALGSMIGGVGSGVAEKALIGNPQHILRDATAGLTPDDFARARRTSGYLANEAIPHTSAQLLDTPTLPSIFNEVSQHPKVAAGIHDKFKDVPQRVTGAIERKMDLELGVPGTTREALSDIQSATAKALQDEMSQANAAYGTRKAAALRNAAPANPDDVVSVADELEAAARKFPIGSPRRTAIMDARRMLFNDDVPITETTKLDAQMRGLGPDPTYWPDNAVTDKAVLANINAELNALVSKHQIDAQDVAVLKAKETIGKLVPEMSGVNARHAAEFENNLSPMNRSLTGRVGKYGGGPKEMRDTASEGLLNQIFPENVNQAEQIVGMGRDLRDFASRASPEDAAQAQSALSGALREKMNQGLNKVNRPVGGFPNANIGGDFVQQVYASPAQKANIKAAVSEAVLAQGKKPEVAARAVEGFDNLLESLNTFNRVNLIPGANPYELGKEMSENMASKAIAPFSAYSQKMQTVARARNAQELSRILSDPEGLRMLEEFARLGPSPGFGEAFAGGALRGIGKMYTAE